ncbi:MAG: glycoside hydrolase family 127 protein [Defluviitaleaceae bacterium]|nr:glycoside hydrolase family 127 protein [Defluviitaleaceae bacterium]
MSRLYFEKYANFERKNEPVRVSIPFPKGKLMDTEKLQVKDTVTQTKALSYWEDGSVKWAKVDFLADLPANASKEYEYGFDFEGVESKPINITKAESIIEIDNGAIKINLNNTPGTKPFHSIGFLTQDQINGPYIIDEDDNQRIAIISGPWEIEEHGPVLTKLCVKGSHFLDFMLTVTIYANTPWFEISYRIINRHNAEYVTIKKIAFDIHLKSAQATDLSLATSNYLTNIQKGESHFIIDDEYLLLDPNEHTPEVFYGTFFADWVGEQEGICATHYQAYQNFPKGLKIEKNLLSIEILPEEYGSLKYYRGMAKSHTFFLHLHNKTDDINKRSLMMQQPDRPNLPAEVYGESGVFTGIFAKNKWQPFHSYIMNLADNRGKAYGILHWGDTPDGGYSQQGRGGGMSVWTNNEYDFPYQAIQLYAQTGERRVLDYALTAAAHLVDIDICHSSDDPLRQGAQIEHSRDHVTGDVNISHQWVEGLFEYYHQTGDKFAYNTAIGVGENISRYLDLPRYHQKGNVNARETGWALRALMSLYQETGDKKWLEKADFIISHFEDWQETYGGFFAPYTDHTLVRVPFMIGVAVASLMRYYRVKPEPKIKNMIVSAMDDLCENAILENGMFYYKELPSLNRPGANPIVLEALACAYELTGDEKYLRAGIPTFIANISKKNSGPGKKSRVTDGVLHDGAGPKGFAQGYYPLTFYYYHISGTNIINELSRYF